MTSGGSKQSANGSVSSDSARRGCDSVFHLNVPMVSGTMSSVQHVREFIRERLTAAAEEIFTEFEKTIVQYEEELDRQSRLLALCWKPQRHLNTPELPQHHVYKEEERLCNQERNCGRNQQEPEPAQIKNKHIEFWTRREDEHLLLKKDTDGFLWKSRVFVNSTVQLEEEMDGQHRPSQINFHSAEPPQQQVNEEEDILNDQQLSDQDKNSSLERHIQTRVSPHITVNQEEPEPPQIKMDQEKPEPPQIKVDLEEPEPSHIKESQKEPEPPQVLEDQEELFSSQDEEQLVLKEEPDIFMVTVNYEESEQSEAEPGSTQLLSHSSNSSPLKGESCLDAGEIKPYSCSTCGKRFSDLSSLNFHQQTHQDEKPFSCEMCLKRFRRRDSMLRHMITHTGERPYSCQVCGDRFGLNSHLLRHMRTHTGEKPFSCQVCHKSFSQSNSLTDHMRIHTGEKPYSCEECGKRFVQRGALTVHMRTHTGEKPYSCSMCGKSFSASTSLLHHIRTHTGERPYSCKICGKTFSQNSNLMTHKRSSHR